MFYARTRFSSSRKRDVVIMNKNVLWRSDKMLRTAARKDLPKPVETVLKVTY